MLPQYFDKVIKMGIANERNPIDSIEFTFFNKTLRQLYPLLSFFNEFFKLISQNYKCVCEKPPKLFNKDRAHKEIFSTLKHLKRKAIYINIHCENIEV